MQAITWIMLDCLGVFGFGLVVILGISSLPSVTQTLSWKEFAWIQSGLGQALDYT